jgi:hypothetical protein
VIVVVLCAGASFGDSLVVPNSYATVNGGTGLMEPFNNGPKIRYQQVYASSEFSAFGGPKWIHGIYFRPDGRIGGFGHELGEERLAQSDASRAGEDGVGWDDAGGITWIMGDETTVLNTTSDGRSPSQCIHWPGRRAKTDNISTSPKLSLQPYGR